MKIPRCSCIFHLHKHKNCVDGFCKCHPQTVRQQTYEAYRLDEGRFQEANR